VKATIDEQFRDCVSFDILVNNAAIFTFGKIEDVTEADWDRIFGTNVEGLLLDREARVVLLEKFRGSEQNQFGFRRLRYCATCLCTVQHVLQSCAVLQLTRCLAMDLAEHNIRVNAVCPGGIHTAATERHAKSEGKTMEQVSQELANLHLIPRLGRPEEVANAVLFLASDEASSQGIPSWSMKDGRRDNRYPGYRDTTAAAADTPIIVCRKRC
jgi:NAD(P)-dependent dehydrogenase (short-subunit alcohol dehydrogenase family)